MFKTYVCGNIAHKWFSTRNNLARHVYLARRALNSALPEEFNQKERSSPTKRPHFKYSDSNKARSFEDKSWGNEVSSSLVESEQEFLVRAKNNPDLFGDGILQPEVVDEGDLLEEKYFTDQPSESRKLSTKQYADMIKGFIKQRKIKEAIDVLEIRMLKEDRVKPERYIYNLLLGACGRVGYTKKAFMLYNDMKKRGLKVMGGTYTALFNACANSPWPLTDGLSRAKQLYDIMIEKGDQPNDTTYNAMIKAFGRCGDLLMAFSLVDDMESKGFNIKDDTINFLLQACIADKETGFRHSLLVWRKLIEKNITPSIYTFNLLLRCVRDCELGDLETTRDVIHRLIGEETDRVALPNVTGVALLNEGDKEENVLDTNVITNNTLTLRPNLLAEKPHLGNILSLSEVKKPEDRLLLLGGCQGFIETMLRHKCAPDIKTFTQLLDCIPGTLAAENDLIIAMKRAQVKADVDFFNMLIKKKSMRFDYDGAKEVLVSMKRMKIRPNLVTYGVLSLSCKNKKEALELVGQIKASRYVLNAAILGTMLKQACYYKEFDYIFEIMELCLSESIPANKKMLEQLQAFKAHMKGKKDAKELSKAHVKSFEIFKARYKTWLTEIQIDETEDAHPWQQYRQTYPEDVKYIPKDTARFKARHLSLFKVKTSTKERY